MKKIIILVDDDVEYMEFGPIRETKVVPSYLSEREFISQGIYYVNFTTNKNKKFEICGCYPAIPIEGKIEKFKISRLDQAIPMKAKKKGKGKQNENS